MKYTLRFTLLATCLLSGASGCGKADPPATAPSNTAPTASAPSTPSQQESSLTNTSSQGSSESNSVSTAPTSAPAVSGSSKPVVAVAEDTQAVKELQQAIVPSAVAVAKVEPATAAQTMELIDLTQLPNIKVKSFLNEEPTYVYYSCESSLAAVDAFYKAEFDSRGWKEVPSIATQTDQYIDRNFTKNDFVVRFSASIGGTKGEISVMLANLGNVDVRQLPLMDDAEPNHSNLVNAGHKTSKSIPDVVESLGKKMLDLGWQPYSDFHTPPSDVPHYRALTFRKNAMRVNLGIVRDPNNPQKTTVFYHADHVIPFDIPTPDSKQSLKLDLSSQRAAFETTGDRTQMVALLKKESDRFRWTIKNAEAFESGDVHGLLIATGPKTALMARLVETKGTLSVWLERTLLKDESKTAEPIAVAALETNTNAPTTTNSPAKTEADKTFNAIQSEVDNAINNELKKALGSLQGLGNAGPVNLADLQAKADALTKRLNTDKEDEDEKTTASAKSNVNPFDVPEDTDPVVPADAKIATSKCTLKHGTTTYKLDQIASYVMMEYGQPVKCIILGEKPLNVDKLKRMLLQGESVHGFDVRSEPFTPMMDIRVSGNSVSINAVVGSNSIGTNSSEMQSTLKYRDGKLIGRVFTAKPMELGKENFEFNVELNQPVLKIDWATRNNPENSALVTDASKEYPIPDNCTSNSMEGTKYLKNVEATVAATVAKVESFYVAEFAKRGWKERPLSNGQKVRKFSDGKEEIELELAADGEDTKIKLVVRNGVAAKADGMIPVAGKAMVVLGNLSEEAIEVTIAGKVHSLSPGAGAADPKDATRVTVEPGQCKIQFKSKTSGKSVSLDANIPAGTTWGALYDTTFQDVLRFF